MSIRVIPDVPSWFGTWSFEWWSFVFMTAQTLIIFLGLVMTAALMIVYERRMLALWQDRYGPNRVGWQGSLQLVADMLKIFFKEDWTPNFADKRLFTLAPAIAMFGALASFAIIPLSPTLGRRIGILAFYFSLPWRAWRCMR